MPVPRPTPILRFIHVDNLETCLRRRALHAANSIPSDGLPWKAIHDTEVQRKRGNVAIPCGPGGCALDYVPFYFGYLSPMLLRLKTGRVEGYNEGQTPLIYLVATAQAVRASGARFVFADGHALAGYTSWFSDLQDLTEVDWAAVNMRYWTGTAENDMDLQRRKQAEFLVHRRCDWSIIQEIAVIDDRMRERVEGILADYPQGLRRVVRVQRGWYY